MNESSVTQNRKKRKISDTLDESPMTHFGRVHMQNNDLATASNESSVTFRNGHGHARAQKAVLGATAPHFQQRLAVK
jgi:hypothetical protein